MHNPNQPQAHTTTRPSALMCTLTRACACLLLPYVSSVVCGVSEAASDLCTQLLTVKHPQPRCYTQPRAHVHAPALPALPVAVQVASDLCTLPLPTVTHVHAPTHPQPCRFALPSTLCTCAPACAPPVQVASDLCTQLTMNTPSPVTFPTTSSSGVAGLASVSFTSTSFGPGQSAVPLETMRAIFFGIMNNQAGLNGGAIPSSLSVSAVNAMYTQVGAWGAGWLMAHSAVSWMEGHRGGLDGE
jgi:hypothetical protein